MAAADYYNPGGQQPTRPPPVSASQGNLNPPYPVSDLPPPYTPYADQARPHSQPPPQHRPSTSDQYRPAHPNAPPFNNTSQYPPDKHGRLQTPPVNNMYRPTEFGGPSTPQPYQQQQQQQQYPQPQGYFPLAGTPAMQQVYGNGSVDNRRPSTTPGYRPPQSPYREESRSRSRSRSRDRSRSRHRKHHHRPQAPRKKPSGVKTFLGAGGGAIIGDVIFPGLGTLGGAILGGLGGHEYGKKRSSSHPVKGRRAYDDDYYDDSRRGRK